MRAHFALIKLKMKHTYVLFDCFMYGNIRNVYINKAQNISLQEQVLSVLKCTDESSLVALGKYLFLAVQIRKK